MRDDLRAYVVEQLGDAQAILVVDETGVVKQGTHSAGVAKPYVGCVGTVENAQVGVFLAYASPQGVAFLDRALVPARGVDRRPGALPAGGHPGGVGVRDQAAVGPGAAGPRAAGGRAGGVGNRR